MNISLTFELERYVQEKLESGLYTSNSEIIREALRLMRAHDELQINQINQLNKVIQVGLDQLDAGNKVSASTSYEKLKKKINNMSKE